jgi:hypothetical protein
MVVWNEYSNIDSETYFIIFHTATAKLEAEGEKAEQQ